ncbi:MAG: tetratricopeptide repeat protein [Paucimonas sp.]|nr:tetratricopeptide repeat protein [Paucimonas sp.]
MAPQTAAGSSAGPTAPARQEASVETVTETATEMAADTAVLLAQATQALQQADFAEAARLLELAVDTAPANVDLMQMAGVLQATRGEHPRAVALLRQAQQGAPERGDIVANLARALWHAGQPLEALECHVRLDELGAHDASTALDRVTVLNALGRHEDALAATDAALALAPDSAAAFSARGGALHALKRDREALESLDRALALAPTLTSAWINKAAVLHHLQRFEEALAHHEGALRLDPANGLGWSNLAGTLMRMERLDEALECCARALALMPAPTPLANQGRGQKQSPDPDQDLTVTDSAGPAAVTTLTVMLYQAHLLLRCKRRVETEQALTRLRTYLPDSAWVCSLLLFHRRCLGDWREDSALLEEVKSTIGPDTPDHPPFVIMGTIDDPLLQKKSIQAFADKKDWLRRKRPVRRPHTSPRIRLAYVSSDFYHHATAYLMNRFFAMHDRQQFEVFAVSLARSRGDDMTAALRSQFDHYIEAGAMSDQELADCLRRHRVDIAVDLKGYTADSRPGLFALRPAPIQVSWLGFPATTAARDIDYVLADRHVIPPHHRRFYTERVVYVDGCYQCNDDQRPIATPAPTRAQCNLPGQAFVFCCMNAIWKITPAMFTVWMRILQAVPGSVLWLLDDNDAAVVNLRLEAAARGIDPQRLVFAPRVAHADHLARLARADLFLDTLPCNAHTTASDSLWAGLPLLTSTGNTFAGRVATSLLHAVELPQLICASVDDYERRAIELATSGRDELERMRTWLQANRQHTALFDTARNCRAVEKVFKQLVAQRESDYAGVAEKAIA